MAGTPEALSSAPTVSATLSSAPPRQHSLAACISGQNRFKVAHLLPGYLVVNLVLPHNQPIEDFQA
jgi:hypothetical protein